MTKEHACCSKQHHHHTGHVCCKTAPAGTVPCCSEGTQSKSTEHSCGCSTQEESTEDSEESPHHGRNFFHKLRPLPFFCLTSSIVLLSVALYYKLLPFLEYIIYEVALFPKNPYTAFLLNFVNDTISLILLTFVMVTPITFIQSFFDMNAIRSFLSKQQSFLGYCMATLAGAVMPFCSCSAIPLFIAFLRAGIPLGLTFAFLLSAPIIHEVAVVLSFSLLGVRFTALYLFLGVTISMSVAYVMSKMHLERFLEPWVLESRELSPEEGNSITNLQQRVLYAVEEAFAIIKDVYLYIALGVAVALLVQNYVSAETVTTLLGSKTWYSVPLALLVGVPFYSCAPTMVPLVQSLIEKGAGFGTAIVFMMSVTALSLPSAILLRRVLKLPLLLLFFGIVTVAFLVVGLILNAVF